MRTAFLWAITQRVLVFLTDVSRKPICPTFKGQEYHSASNGISLPTFRDNLSVQSSRVKNLFITSEDGTDRLPRNVGKAIPLLAA